MEICRNEEKCIIKTLMYDSNFKPLSIAKICVIAGLFHETSLYIRGTK